MLVSLLRNATLRPFLLLVLMTAILGAIGGERVLSTRTLYSVLQQFSLLGPVALALGLTMMVRHFDLSVVGTVTLAGCVAVLAGSQSSTYGLALAALVGLAAGAFQGALIINLRLSSIAVTLGGMLTLVGVAFLLTGNSEVAYANRDVARIVDSTVFGPFSLRFLIAVAIFAVAGAVIGGTRFGPQLYAVGSDPKAAIVAGVSTGSIVVAVFALSGLLSAISGALLSFSLSAASPSALSNILVPAAASAIIGGVSLAGGRGSPVGIAGGVLLLCCLQSGLTAIGVEPYSQDIATGCVLLLVAVMDGAELARRFGDWSRVFAGTQKRNGKAST
ncbi:MAG: ABC transporter permease [Pseudomonadota bacterium]|nr:ABC transporter permease [Pseudomonadota bacterium]